jgi:tyrosine-protein kinase Etk/Wzc
MTVEAQERTENVNLTIDPPAVVVDDGIDFISIIKILKVEWRTIAVVSAVMFVVASVIAFSLPPQYTSITAIIPPSSGNSSSAMAGQLSALGASSLLGGAAKNPSDLYVGILKSRSIAEEMVKRFNLTAAYDVKESRAEKILASNSTFEIGAKDSIIHVSVSDRSPERARDMARAYFDILRETNDRLALSESSQRRLFFGQQLAKEKNDLENAEVSLRKTEEESGVIAPVGQTISEIQTIATIRGQLAQRQVQLAALRQYQTDQSPDVVRLQSEIASLQSQLSSLQSVKRRASGDMVSTSMIPALQLEYVRKEREVKYHESLFQILAKQYESARLDEAHDAPLLQILDSPSYPDTKSSPHRMLIMLGGLIFGCALSCFWALFKDYIWVIRSL